MSDQPPPDPLAPLVPEAAPVPPGNLGRADYPRMLYHPDGSTMVVDSPGEHDELARQGWAQEPMDVHRQPVVTRSPAMSSADPMGLMMRAVVEAILDERGITAQWAATLSPGNVDPNAMQWRRTTNGTP